MKEKKQYKSNLEQAQEYVKDNVWKRFWKYKLFELGIVPTAALAIWKIPTILGWGFINLFNINPAKSTWFCSKLVAACDGVHYSDGQIYGTGFMILAVLIGVIWINWMVAKENVTDEARKKFDISYYQKV